MHYKHFRQKKLGFYFLIIGLWIVTEGSVLGVYANLYYWTAYTEDQGLIDNNVTSLVIDPGEHLWIATGAHQDSRQGGISILDRMQEFTSYNKDNGLRSNFVQAIAFERIPEAEYNNLDKGAIWIATTRGISVLNRMGQWMSVFSGNSPLPGNDIVDIFINNENTKWIAIKDNGICCLDTDFNWEKYSATDGLCSNAIICISQDSNGNVWFGSQQSGVSRLDIYGNWITFTSENSGLINNSVREIAEEKPNKIWFATPQGVSVFDGQNWMSYAARNSPLADLRPTTIAVDGNGHKWIGTERGGLLKLDNFGGWTHFHQENSDIIDNRVNAITIDGQGGIWVGTPSGLCNVSLFPKTTPRVPPQQEFQKPTPIGLGIGSYYPFEDAITWKNIDEVETSVGLSFGLPSLFYSGKLWFYSVFWADEDFNFNEAAYSMVWDRQGTLKVNLQGNFSQAHFLTVGGLLTKQKNLTIDKKASYPFPATYPAELEAYLLPGEHIPAEQPKIRAIVDSLISVSSRGDMFQTARDIIYSQLIQNMALDETSIGLLHEREPGEESARVSFVQEVPQTLQGGKGGQHAKARLVCTLARAAGIPARTVMSNGGNVWSQFWLAGLGWVPVEVSYPIYDYIRPLRTYLPKLLYPEEHVIISLSGTDDDVGRLAWQPEVKAFYMNTAVKDLKNYHELSTARIIFFKIVSEEKVPADAKMEVAEEVFAVAVQREGEVQLLFQDRLDRELKSVVLSFDGLSFSVSIEDQLFWQFIPRRMSQILIIENLMWRTKEDFFENNISEGSEPMQGIADR